MIISFSSEFAMKKNLYGLLTFLMMLLFITLSGVVFYQFIPILDFSMFSTNPFHKKSKYIILNSADTKAYMRKNGLSIDNHTKTIDKFRKRLEDNGIETRVTDEEGIAKLSKNSVLIAADVYALSHRHEKMLLDFIKKGGRVLFNFQFAYFYPNGKYRGDRLVKKITGLKSIKRTVTKNPSDGIFMIPKLLSPLAYKNSKPVRMDLILYDPLPVFKSDKTVPDMMLSNWAITSTPLLGGSRLALDSAGVAWHGNYGKGSWYYFSFPVYSFLEMRDEEKFIATAKNALEFLAKRFTVVPYPYLDAEKVIFISEDTEFKYTNLTYYSKLCHKYDINTTLFCVAKLAEKHPDITKEVSDLKGIEMASHGYSHTKIIGEREEKVKKEIAGSKKILEKITGKKVYGFRPPREEIDKLMAETLIDSGYIYTMEHTKDYLLPYYEHRGLITIPRHGTDDYLYFVKQQLNDNSIVENIIYETEMLTRMNILYTLSLHTHLLSEKENLLILENYLKYLKKNKDVTVLNGKSIAMRAKLLSSIALSTSETTGNIIVTIDNRNDREVKNFTFRLYWPNLERVGKVKSEILGLGVYEKMRDNDKKYIDITVPRLSPKSATALFLPYKG